MSGDRLFAPPDVEVQPRPDGVRLLRSRESLGEYARSVCTWLFDRSEQHPDRLFLAERADAGAPWKTVTYAQTLAAARAIGQSLLDMGMGPGNPVAVLSGPSIAHAQLMLGAHLAGVPFVPVSVA